MHTTVLELLHRLSDCDDAHAQSGSVLSM